MTYWDAPPGGKDVHREVWQILSAKKGKFKKQTKKWNSPHQKRETSLSSAVFAGPLVVGFVILFEKNALPSMNHNNSPLTWVSYL